MCRGKDHGGRRCPNDTSNARLARYHNSKLRSQVESVAKISTSVVETVEPAVEPVRDENAVRDEFNDVLTAFNKFYGEGAAERRNDLKLKLGDEARENNWGREKYARLIVENDLDESARLKAPKIQLLGELIYELASFEEGFKTDDEISEIIEQKTKEVEDDTKKPYSEREHLEYVTHVSSVRARMLSERAQHLKSALEKTGVKFFDEDKDEILTVGSTKAAVDGLKRGLEFIPAHWVELSNENAGRTYPLKVALVGRGRAHYTNSDNHKENTRRVRRYTEIKPVDFEPHSDPTRKEFYEYEAKLSGLTPYEAPDGFKAISMVSPGEDGDYQEWVRKSTEWEFGVRKPRGHGWKKIDGPVTFNHFRMKADGEYGAEDVAYDNVWYRHPKESVSTDYKSVSLAKIPNDAEGYSKYDTSVTAHEFCHRVERLIPEVSSIERDFLFSRKKYDEELVNVTPGEPDEVGYADDFKNIYAGKVYSHGQAYELLTMGIQQLFYGTHGGFVGEAKDEDYRNFVIGLFAAYGKPNPIGH